MALIPLATQGNYLHIYDFRVDPAHIDDFVKLFNEFVYSPGNPMNKSAAQVKDGVLCQDVADATHFSMIAELSEIEVHARIRRILTDELMPSLYRHVVGLSS